MSIGASLRPPHEVGLLLNHGRRDKFKVVDMQNRHRVLRFPLSSCSLRQDSLNLHVSERISRRHYNTPCKSNVFMCRSFAFPSSAEKVHLFKSATSALMRSRTALQKSSLVTQLLPAVGIIAFAAWGLGPLMRQIRKIFLQNDSNWKQSRTYYVFSSYLRPLLLWSGALFICKVLDPIVLLSEESQVIMHRLLAFVRSLSTVLAFAYCFSNLIKQMQKFFMESNSSNDTRNMGFQFAGKAVYTAVWVAAASLFMELLGFSTQKWITAGGLGTVLLTLAGREIFTNFLSSIMIHATRPFVVNEWIQTKIEGYEVSGTVEHVGWWSPTIIRGEDREAVHIPNHQFTVNVVRNLSQKTHWRIKTHLAISHLDVNKINNIVADMRKVLAKNPQVEHKRLHRRVFLENISSENQALMILVSCFVKTSHIEEYMCVKEAILLDLLRVISHHRARLATPIRTMQKIYVDPPNLENVPFSDTIFTRYGASSNRPMLLVEPSTRINSNDKAKARTSPRSNEEQTRKTPAASDPKASSVSEGTVKIVDQQQQKPESGDAVSNNLKVDSSPGIVSGSSKQQHEILEADGLNSKVGSERPPLLEDSSEKCLLSEEAGSEQDDAIKIRAKHEIESLTSALHSTPRPMLEDNILLGAVLDGSKRTLPIEEGMGPKSNPAEMKELTATRNGSGPFSSTKDKGEITTSNSAATDPHRKRKGD